MQELCSLGTCVVRAHDGEPDTLGHTLGRVASDPLCEVTLEQTFQGSRLRCPGHLGYISGKGEGSSPHPHPTTDSSGREDRHILAAIKNLLVSHLSPSRKGFLSLGLTIRRRTEGPQAAPPWVSLCLRPVCRRQLPGLSLLLRPEKLYSRPTCSAEPASFGARLHLLRRPVGGALYYATTSPEPRSHPQSRWFVLRFLAMTDMLSPRGALISMNFSNLSHSHGYCGTGAAGAHSLIGL